VLVGVIIFIIFVDTRIITLCVTLSNKPKFKPGNQIKNLASNTTLFESGSHNEHRETTCGVEFSSGG
jgi:hypothetical protein